MICPRWGKPCPVKNYLYENVRMPEPGLFHKAITRCEKIIAKDKKK